MNYLYLIIFGLFVNWSDVSFGEASSSGSGEQEVRQQKLANWGNRFGNKTANMKLLKDDVKEFPNVRVPDFFGLGSDEIINALKESEAWQHIVEEWAGFQEVLRDEPNTLSTTAKNRLSSIRAQIDQQQFSFKNMCTNKKRRKKLNAFITKAGDEKYLLMVRSTGREDGKELSNAGGNASKSSVLPQENAISDAIKEVLSSYFSEKSIMQRLVGGDPNLATGEPFMPVLLQFMMGEGSGQYPDEIPHSGVIYSTEGEGNTPGVTIIQSTLGHNEAVVNGLAPVDTYYISKDGVINPVIRVKQSRLKTVDDELELVPNPRELKRSSTLTAAQVRRLKIIADRLEEKYGYPVDIEFVIIKQVIYLVQARPLEEKDMDPSYLAKEYFDALSDNDKIMGTTIGVGNAKTNYITSPHEVIVAENIRKALAEYLELMSKDPSTKQRIKAVIVGEMAPSTSHEANQFRGQKKSVMYISNFGAVKVWLKEKRHVFVDPQRGVVALSVSQNPMSAIKDGWFTHPIPQQISLFPEFFIEAKPTYPAQAATWAKNDEITFLLKQNVDVLLDYIKNGEIDVADKACDILLVKVIRSIRGAQSLLKKKIAEGTETNEKLGLHLEGLLRQFYLIINEQKAVLAKPGFTEIERLYPLTFINALLKQISDRELIANFSLGSLLKTEKIEQQALNIIDLKDKPLRAYFVQYAKATDFALVDELKDEWQNYLKDLVQNNDDATQKQFTTIVYDLATLDTLPLWINTSFAQLARGSGPGASSSTASEPQNAPEITEKLISEFDQSHDFLAELKQINDYFKPFPVGSFDEPAAFEKQWKLFSDKLRSLVLSDGFMSRLNDAERLGKLAAIQTLNTVVATFDNSIKALTGSTKYTSENDKTVRIHRFKRMIETYFTLFERLAKLPYINDELESLCPNMYPLKDYLTEVKKIFEGAPINAGQLIASKEFNVAGATLGSKTSWSISTKGNYRAAEPPTLENAFSLIHQNLLVILATMSQKEGLANVAVPPTVGALNEAAQTMHFSVLGFSGYSQLIGAAFEKNTLTYFYNLPIRDHSNTFKIIYNFISKRIFLEASFIGDNAVSRWDQVESTIMLISATLNMPISKTIEIINQGETGTITFGWEIISEHHREVAPIIIQTLAEWTIYPVLKSPNILWMLCEAVNITMLDIAQSLPAAAQKNPKILLESGSVLKQLVPTDKTRAAYISAVTNLTPLMCATLLKYLGTGHGTTGDRFLDISTLTESLTHCLKTLTQLNAQMPSCLPAFFEKALAINLRSDIADLIGNLIATLPDGELKSKITRKTLHSPNEQMQQLGAKPFVLSPYEHNVPHQTLRHNYQTLLATLNPQTSPYLVDQIIALWKKLAALKKPADRQILNGIIRIAELDNPAILNKFLKDVLSGDYFSTVDFLPLAEKVCFKLCQNPNTRPEDMFKAIDLFPTLISRCQNSEALTELIIALRDYGTKSTPELMDLPESPRNQVSYAFECLLNKENLTPQQEDLVLEVLDALWGKYNLYNELRNFKNPSRTLRMLNYLDDHNRISWHHNRYQNGLTRYEPVMHGIEDALERDDFDETVLADIEAFLNKVNTRYKGRVRREAAESLRTWGKTQLLDRILLIRSLRTLNTYRPTEGNQGKILAVNQALNILADAIKNDRIGYRDIPLIIAALHKIALNENTYNQGQPDAEKISIDTRSIAKALINNRPFDTDPLIKTLTLCIENSPRLLHGFVLQYVEHYSDRFTGQFYIIFNTYKALLKDNKLTSAALHAFSPIALAALPKLHSSTLQSVFDFFALIQKDHPALLSDHSDEYQQILEAANDRFRIKLQEQFAQPAQKRWFFIEALREALTFFDNLKTNYPDLWEKNAAEIEQLIQEINIEIKKIMAQRAIAEAEKARAAAPSSSSSQ